MRKHNFHKSSLFLMELIIAILFFALASAVCIRFFAKSYELSHQAEALNAAVNRVSTRAEYLLHTDDQTALMEPEYFAKDFQTCSSDKAVYEMTTTDSADGVLTSYLITFKEVDSKEPIYTLTVERRP